MLHFSRYGVSTTLCAECAYARSRPPSPSHSPASGPSGPQSSAIADVLSIATAASPRVRGAGRYPASSVRDAIRVAAVAAAPGRTRVVVVVETEKPGFDREPHELRTGVTVELLMNMRAVSLDRAQARAEELRDLCIGVAEREQVKDVGLLRR